MKRRELLKNLAIAMPALYFTNGLKANTLLSGQSLQEQIAKGPFKPDWQSLKQYKTPEWYKDAKFGIWAHWGPQCQPEAGDWYARGMYQEGSNQNKFHLEKYGHPSVFGFKDVINEWKAEKWDPEELVSLYKRAGAKYFMAMANHHDNMDLFESTYQPNWNSTKVGPKKDIIRGWANAAKNNDLPFGVSVHAAHAWNWFETSQRSDKNGPHAGLSYDGKMTKADGKGKWWDGIDPQELYAQNHPLSENSEDDAMIHRQWNWGNGVARPSDAYIEKFYKRTIELIDKYSPDLVYFDDTALPLWPISDAGLKIAAHLYNSNLKKNGKLEAVLNGKILDKEQRQCMVWDIEKGRSNELEPFVWQSGTCLGNWHYDRSVFDRHGYKSAKSVIHNLIDIVSKNGNMLLNVPVRGDGTIDSDERALVEEIGAWINNNGECIFSTRPWKVFGEGPAQENAAALTAQGFNESGGKPFSSLDYRFTTKEKSLFAISLGWPESGKALIKSLSKGNPLRPEPVNGVEFLGHGNLKFEQKEDGLEVILPENKPELNYACSLKIS